MKTKKKVYIQLSSGPICYCNSEKIILLYEELPPNEQKTFKKNNANEVSHYLHCTECLNYTAISKDGKNWF